MDINWMEVYFSIKVIGGAICLGGWAIFALVNIIQWLRGKAQ